MSPVGAVTLCFLGQGRLIRGGPFDAYEAPAISLCLEPTASRAHEAMLRLPLADFTAPSPARLEATLAALLAAMRDSPELPVYIGCRAGIGRTGMLIAALARLAGHADPIAWVRAHYHPGAVETAAQQAVVAAFSPQAVWSRLEEPR